MTIVEYSKEISRLQTAFGKRMGQEQVESWFGYLAKYEARAMRIAVDQMVTSKHVLPSLAEVLGTVETFDHTRASRRETLETAIHPNQLPLARFCFKLLDCFTYESIQTVLNTACELRKDLTDIYVKMSKARFETLPRTAPQPPQLEGET